MQPFTLGPKRGSKFVWVYGRDWTGADYQESTGQIDHTAALIEAQRIHRERSLEGVRPLAIRDAYDTFYEYKQVKCKVSDAELEHVQKVLRVIEFLGEDFNINATTLDHFEEYVVQRRKHVVGKPRLSATPRYVTDSTIGKELGKYLELLRYMSVKGKYTGGEKSIAVFRDALTRMLVPSPKRTRWLKDDEFLRLWNSLPEVRRDYFIAWTLAGARFGEISRITSEHINHEERQLFLRGRKGHVDHRERWVPLHEDLYRVLVRRAEMFEEGTALFPVWANSNANAMLRRHCDKLGIKRVTCNDLRRTFITWHGKHGTPESVMKKFAGHSPNSRMVADVYRQLASEEGRASTAEFPTVLPRTDEREGNVIRPARFWQSEVSEKSTWLRATVEELRAQLTKLGSQRAVAEHYGVTQGSVTRRFKRLGIVRAGKREIAADEIRAALDAHGSAREASKALGIPRSTFLVAMKRHGVKEARARVQRRRVAQVRSEPALLVDDVEEVDEVEEEELVAQRRKAQQRARDRLRSQARSTARR